MVFRKFLGNQFIFGRTPTGRKRWSNFPMLEVLLGGESGRPKSFSPKLRKFFTLYVLADWTPRGGKSENTGVLGRFGTGQSLALKEILSGKKNYQECT